MSIILTTLGILIPIGVFTLILANNMLIQSLFNNKYGFYGVISITLLQSILFVINISICIVGFSMFWKLDFYNISELILMIPS